MNISISSAMHAVYILVHVSLAVSHDLLGAPHAGCDLGDGQGVGIEIGIVSELAVASELPHRVAKSMMLVQYMLRSAMTLLELFTPATTLSDGEQCRHGSRRSV
jgi:hypothetical protein